MTVHELYELARKEADPRKVELRLHPDGDNLVEVVFRKEDRQVAAYLVEEGAIHL